MRWKKLGRVFVPDGKISWMESHAALPIAQPRNDGLFNVYFSARDNRQRSHTGCLVLELSEKPRVVHIDKQPILAPGKLGCFDDSGAMLTWIAENGANHFFYYAGWNLGATVPFHNAIGLAISTNGALPTRDSEGPILDRSPIDPYFVGTVCVLRHEGIWRMWYQSCTGWGLVQTKPHHRYLIKYAESLDGRAWQCDGAVAIDYSNDTECAICRPCVIRDKDIWRMWYCYRGRSYRIGYAESENGINWQRMDSCAGLDLSNTGWDAEMTEYPYVFDYDGQRFMLYNGNGYGQTGFGLAVLEG